MTEGKTVPPAVCPSCYGNAGMHFEGCRHYAVVSPQGQVAELLQALREAKRALWRHARHEGAAAIRQINAALAKAGAAK